MPDDRTRSRLFVVGDERSLDDLQSSLFKSRLSARVRTEALEALRRANPGLDLDHVDRGTVVFVPDTDAVRPKASDSPAGDAADERVAALAEALDALLQGAEDGEKARREEGDEARRVLDNDVVRKLAGRQKPLAENLKSVAAVLDADDADAHQQLVRAREAQAQWLEELQELRGLL